MIELCSQCKHPKHIKAHITYSEPSIAFSNGCPIMVYMEIYKNGGYYHEHCDCDGGIDLEEGEENGS